MKKWTVVIVALMLGALAQSGSAMEAETALHLRAQLATPIVFSTESRYALEVGAQMNTVDTYGLRGVAKVTPTVAAFADVGYYSPDVGDSDITLQAGVLAQLMRRENLSIGVRGAFAYPMMDMADIYMFVGDVYASWDCDKIAGLGFYAGVGGAYYSIETDFGFEDDGFEPEVSVGIDYKFAGSFYGGVGVEYTDGLVYGIRMGYSF